MKKIFTLIGVVLFGFTYTGYSQKNYSDNAANMDSSSNLEVSKKTRPAQISFITPMGTNGLESHKIVNNFSLNMMAGYSGGVKGAEIGGFANVTNGETKGFQLAGFANVSKEKVVGCQIGGFTNVCTNNVTGMQVAGFVNVAKDTIKALQLSGFANVSNGMPIGGQITGFANVNTGNAKGAQIAGFFNYNNGDITGAQLSGFVNIAKDSIKALQLSGFTNVARGMPAGGQITGFANVNIGDAKGVQIAGFSNISEGDFSGLQISGFFNRVKKLKGAQIGFINVADTIEKGIAIGFLSIVKDGYRAFEIGGSETFYGIASFKTGVERFYNIISLGAKIQNNDFVWGVGYGVGTMFPVHKKVKMNFDIIAYHVNENQWWTQKLNLLNKLNLTANYKINDFLTIYGGLTWNIQISEYTVREGAQVATSYAPWSVYDKDVNNSRVLMYPGFTVGVRL